MPGGARGEGEDFTLLVLGHTGTLGLAAHNAHVSIREQEGSSLTWKASNTVPRPVRTAKDRSVWERRCMVVLVGGAVNCVVLQGGGLDE